MDLLLASGAVRTLTPEGADANAFWATAGGMGLTGIVLRATLDLIPITSAYVRVDTERPVNLDDCMQRMAERDDDPPRGTRRPASGAPRLAEAPATPGPARGHGRPTTPS